MGILTLFGHDLNTVSIKCSQYKTWPETLTDIFSTGEGYLYKTVRILVCLFVRF